MGFLVPLRITVPPASGEFLPYWDEIIPLIAPFRKGLVLPQSLPITGPQGLGQKVDLASFIVQVVLPGHLPAELGEKLGQDIAQGCLAAVPHGQGAGGIRGDELHLKPFSLAQGLAAVGIPLFEDRAQGFPDHLGAEAEVDETTLCPDLFKIGMLG